MPPVVIGVAAAWAAGAAVSTAIAGTAIAGTLMGSVLVGVVAGAVGGAASAAVSGGNIGKSALKSALFGGITAGIAHGLGFSASGAEESSITESVSSQGLSPGQGGGEVSLVDSVSSQGLMPGKQLTGAAATVGSPTSGSTAPLTESASNAFKTLSAQVLDAGSKTTSGILGEVKGIWSGLDSTGKAAIVTMGGNALAGMAKGAGEEEAAEIAAKSAEDTLRLQAQLKEVSYMPQIGNQAVTKATAPHWQSVTPNRPSANNPYFVEVVPNAI